MGRYPLNKPPKGEKRIGRPPKGEKRIGRPPKIEKRIGRPPKIEKRIGRPPKIKNDVIDNNDDVIDNNDDDFDDNDDVVDNNDDVVDNNDDEDATLKKLKKIYSLRRDIVSIQLKSSEIDISLPYDYIEATKLMIEDDYNEEVKSLKKQINLNTRISLKKKMNEKMKERNVIHSKFIELNKYLLDEDFDELSDNEDVHLTYFKQLKKLSFELNELQKDDDLDDDDIHSFIYDYDTSDDYLTKNKMLEIKLSYIELLKDMQLKKNILKNYINEISSEVEY
jgi:hypothetical protein